MATIVNSRDLKLQATTPRFIPVRPQGIYLVESSDNFIVTEDGSAFPSTGITYALDIVGVNATDSPVFTVTAGTASLSSVEDSPGVANPNKAKLLFGDMLSDSVTVSASLTDVTGAVFTTSINTQKIRQNAVGVSVTTQGTLFRVDTSGAGTPAVMEVYVAPQFLEFDTSPIYTLTAVDSAGVTIAGITLVPDAVKELTWLLDYDEVAMAGVLSFGVKVSVTDKYSITYTDTALIDVLVAGSSSVRISSTSPFFVKPKTSSTLTPSTVKFTAVTQGVTDPVSWVILDQSSTPVGFTTGTDTNGNATATVTNSQFGNSTLVTVTATAGTYSDTTTVQLVDEAVDGVFVAMANSLHEFDADAVGSIYSFVGSGSTFTVYEGSNPVPTYDSSFPYSLGSYRFGVPVVVTDVGSISAPVLSSGGLSNYSSMSANTATVTIPVIVTKLDGSVVTVNVSQTLVKKKRGAVVSLSSTASSFAYNSAGTTPAPTSATITATVANISPTLTTWYSTITVGAGAESARSGNVGNTKTYAYTPKASYATMPETVTIKVYDASSGGNLIGTASLGMGATKVGDAGADGRTYALNVTGGTRSFTYNAAGTASAPTTSAAFSAVLTLDGATVTPTSYSWSAAGRMSGTSTSSTFTPTVNQTYVAESTSVTLTVVHGSPAVSTSVTVPIAIAKVGDTGSSTINGTLTKESYIIPSLQDGTGYASYLSAGGGTFKVTFGTTDVTTSSVFNIVGGTDGGATWTKVQNGLTFTINETTGVYSLSGAAWTSDSENFTVTATYSGTTVTKIYTITKAKQGLPGKKTVVVKVFKWDTSAAIPTADSSYNWNTNVLSLGSVTGWATTVPSSTSSGQKLYELSKLLIVDVDYTGTSTVNWNTADVLGPIGVINEIGIRQDGSIGPTGPRGQTGYVYYTLESATAPATPTASSFNFSTGAFTGLTANWATTYNVPSPTATTTNEKYWSSRYVVSEATFGGTQTISFSAAFVHTNFDGLVTFTNLASGTNGAGTSTTFIDGGALTTGSVTANKITTTSLSAIQSNLGTVDIATAGYVRSGKTTASDGTNAGFFLGYTSPTYTFFIGNAGDTVSLKYDGNLTMKGGTVNVGTTGAVYGGKSTYASTTAGFFLGYDSSAYRLKIGDASSSFAWDGSSLAVVGGTITGGVIRTGSGTTRVEMSSATNDLVAYRAGVKIADLGNNGDDTILNVMGWSSSSLKPSVVFKNDFGGTALKVVSKLTGGNAGIGAVLQSKGSYALIVEPEGSTGSEAATTPLSLFQTSSSRPNSPVAKFVGGSGSDALILESTATSATHRGLSVTTSGASGVNIATGSGWGISAASSNAAFTASFSNSGTGEALSVGATSNSAISASNNNATNSTIKATNTNSSGVAIEAIGRVEASKTLRVTGSQPPSSGAGIELAYSGNIGYVTAYNRGTTSAQPLHIISSETVLGGVTKVPASPTTAGTQGQIAWDTNYIYVCTAANTWRRAALSTW